MANSKSRRNVRSKRNLSKKNRSRKNRNSRRVKGGVFGFPDMGFKKALGLDCESRLKSQKCAFRKALSKSQVGETPKGYNITDCDGNTTPATRENTKDVKECS